MGVALSVVLMVVIGVCAVSAVVAAVVLGYGTIALALGILSSAAFAARTV